MTDLIQARDESRRLMKEALKERLERGRIWREADRNYHIIKAETTARLLGEGKPATLVKDLVRGDKAVAEADYERGLAKDAFENSTEAINVYKIDVKVIEGDIDREWHSQ